MPCPSCGSELQAGSPTCARCAPTNAATLALTYTAATNLPLASIDQPDHTDSPAERFLPGAVIASRYRIVSMLGRGGMGEVYRADDLTLGQTVALKFLPRLLSRNEDALRRFRNEVRIARQVSHPNVCRVHDMGEVDGQLFLSMEYIDGEDLASLLRRIGRLPEDKALEIARKLCAGLAAAHEKGVLHRDLKPGNVMLDARGQVVLTDFGLAAAAAEVTGSEVRSGTPAYMAPEQLTGREVTALSDIYALGLVLYELFAGKRPFEAESLAELTIAREENTPVSLSSHVRDLDPAIEKVISRCLQADPARRPASALAVWAALPGGDPLAAALAAGETPSPEMVAAAGEDVGLRARFAVPLTAAILLSIGFHVYLEARSSALEVIRPPQSPDVLRHQAKTLLGQLGYGHASRDSEHGFLWGEKYIAWSMKQTPRPQWSEILRGRAPALRFWYRDSRYPMTGSSFHDDLLTLGVVLPDDPPPIMSGMSYVELDIMGRLIEFRSMPAEKVTDPLSIAAEPDWTPLFRAASLDSAKLTPAQPQWRFLEASDTRAAWTGVWPGSDRPLRVEAAALLGRPVAFVLLGPWAETSRMPSTDGDLNWRSPILALVGLVILICSASLARLNLMRGRGDRRGALRLAVFVFALQIVLWAARVHITPGTDLLGLLMVAIATATFFGVLVWTLYLALEPYVRRHWPRTIIASTRLLSGQIRDAMVGRDILIGAALSCTFRLLNHARIGPSSSPGTPSETFLTGFRAAFGEALEVMPHAVRDALLFFFLIFLLRVLLRNEWLGAAAFAALLTAVAYSSGVRGVDLAYVAYIEASIAFVTLRFGLLALSAAILIDGVLGDMPATFDLSAWYAPSFVLMVLFTVALILWSFRQSVRGQRFFSGDPFG